MQSPPSNTGRPKPFVGCLALTVTVVAIAFTIFLIIRYGSSSSAIAIVTFVVAILSLFFGFLQAFPTAGQQVASLFSFRPFLNRITPGLPRLLIVLVVGLVLLNVGQATIILSNQSNSHSSSNNPQEPTFLYQADWSPGLNGWHGSPQWSANNDVLSYSGNSSQVDYVTAPYQPTSPNYALEAQIIFEKAIPLPAHSANPQLFGLFARGGPNSNDAGYGAYANIPDMQAKIRRAQVGDAVILDKIDFIPYQSLHTYRLEVKGDSITFYIDKIKMLQVSDSTYSSPGLIGVFDSYCQIEVRSFKVFQL